MARRYVFGTSGAPDYRTSWYDIDETGRLRQLPNQDSPIGTVLATDRVDLFETWERIQRAAPRPTDCPSCGDDAAKDTR
jgi:hypothetical protein